jgi:hypothetical protein
VLSEVFAQRLIHRRRIAKHLRDIRIEKDDVRTLGVCCGVLAAHTFAEIVLISNLVVSGFILTHIVDVPQPWPAVR